jgi:hypothetical protein
MRLWTLHPRYLDARGLVAAWREGLLAQRVLSGATRGYRHHPQLIRFRATADPARSIAAFLVAIAREAKARGYVFDDALIVASPTEERIPATSGQLLFEWHHLAQKLAHRAPEWLRRWEGIANPDPHPLFAIEDGEIAAWEKAIEVRSEE